MSADAARLRTTPEAAFYDARDRDPEARLLNMRELGAIRDAHVPRYWFDPPTPARPFRLWRAACSCGAEIMPARDLSDVADLAARHLSDVIDFTKGRKVAEAKARAERARIDAEIDAALQDGYDQAGGRRGWWRR